MGTRKEYQGAAAATTLNGGIDSDDTTVTLTAATGWPSGGTYPFVVCIGRGTASEEKILCSSRSGNNLTVSSRGYDSTTGVAHVAGDTVEHVLDAVTVSEANRHVNDTTQDDHTQYLNTTRHDITARHAFGSALGTPGTPASVAATGTAGSGTAPAREDHVHDLAAAVAGNGLALSAGVLAVGVDGSTVELSSDQVRVKDGGIVAAKLGTSAVETAKINDAAVTNAKYGGTLGTLGYASVTSNQTGLSGSVTDLSGLSATVTVASGRRIEIIAQGMFNLTSGSTGAAALYIRESSTTLNALSFYITSVSTQGGVVHAILTPTAGSHTYKISAVVSVAGSLIASATAAAFILVKDIGV